MGEIAFCFVNISQSIEKPAQVIAMPIYKFNNHNSNVSVEKDFYLGTLLFFSGLAPNPT
jgi:hypothetical protein